MTKEEMAKVLEDHAVWLRDSTRGNRAHLVWGNEKPDMALIAAAPELLKACEELSALLADYIEGTVPWSPYKNGKCPIYILGAEAILERGREAIAKAQP